MHCSYLHHITRPSARFGLTPPLVVLVLVLVLTPPGQHKLKHDDTVVPRGVLCFCGSARGVYGNESGRGECGLIMEESSAGAAFILVPRVARMLSMYGTLRHRLMSKPNQTRPNLDTKKATHALKRFPWRRLFNFV